MFIIFFRLIHELALENINNGKDVATFAHEIFILLFAGDIVFMSQTVIGLQN